jgi:hypothetical protein
LDLLRPEVAQHHLVGVPVREEIHGARDKQRDHHAARAAHEITNGAKERCHRGQQDVRLEMVHLSPHLSEDIESQGQRFNMDDEIPPPRRKLTPEAERALAEAEARRAAQAEEEKARELGGATGPEPTRYGDWERKGIASDF